MKFIADESATKLRGGYYTDRDICDFLTRWVLRANPRDILEPSCGAGAFIDSIIRLAPGSLESVTAIEIEPDEAAKAAGVASVASTITFDVQSRDFLAWARSRIRPGRLFDGVLGNPPYIRYQYMNDSLQRETELIAKLLGLKITRHTNVWVPFVMASIALLRPGGRLGMVVPAEILHVLHAHSLREYLGRTCSRIVVVDPQELLFAEALQGAVLLLAERRQLSEHPQGVAIVPTRGKEFLSQDPEDLLQSADCANGEAKNGKWMHALLSRSERQLVGGLEASPKVHRFDELADVDVGIVTGANQYFLVTDDIVNEFDLHNYVYPMFGRSDYVPGILYDQYTHEENKCLGKRTNFIWIRQADEESLSDGARRYIRLGESEKLHMRYKCRVRSPWYTVPSVYSTSIGMLKRSHLFPRLVLNRLGAYTTDTCYRIRSKQVSDESLVASFVNSLTALSAELEGRHYGGGVLELVPSEIERLLVPLRSRNLEDVEQLDRKFRSSVQPEAILRMQDQTVLDEVDVSASDQDRVHAAWLRLRDRRHRLEHDAAAEGDRSATSPVS